MSTNFDTQLRDVLRSGPAPDILALQAGIRSRVVRHRRRTMLLSTAGAGVGVAAVVAMAIAVSGQLGGPPKTLDPAVPSTSKGSVAQPSLPPDTTDFAAATKNADGSYLLPTDFPDVAPATLALPSGRASRVGDPTAAPFPVVVPLATYCIDGPQTGAASPWGARTWSYSSRRGAARAEAAVSVSGWAKGSGAGAFAALIDNSGACTFDRPMHPTTWEGQDPRTARAWVIDSPRAVGGHRGAAVLRLGDVLVGASADAPSDVAAAGLARSLVETTAARLTSSGVLEAPTPFTWEFPGGGSPGRSDTAAFWLPDIAPLARDLPTGLTEGITFDGPDDNLVPVYGAQVGDPAQPGDRYLSARSRDYGGYNADGTTDPEVSAPLANLVWTSWTDGRHAFDQLVEDKGTARWAGSMTRRTWSGHDPSVAFLGELTSEKGFTTRGPTFVALRLEGDVIVAVTGVGRTGAEAREIATATCDEAVAELRAMGRGPSGAPGGGH